MTNVKIFTFLHKLGNRHNKLELLSLSMTRVTQASKIRPENSAVNAAPESLKPFYYGDDISFFLFLVFNEVWPTIQKSIFYFFSIKQKSQWNFFVKKYL
jgi:hypothetical protein